jgi:hypothetical protein
MKIDAHFVNNGGALLDCISYIYIYIYNALLNGSIFAALQQCCIVVVVSLGSVPTHDCSSSLTCRFIISVLLLLLFRINHDKDWFPSKSCKRLLLDFYSLFFFFNFSFSTEWYSLINFLNKKYFKKLLLWYPQTFTKLSKK